MIRSLRFPRAERLAPVRIRHRFVTSVAFGTIVSALVLADASPAQAQDALPSREELEQCMSANVPDEPGVVDFAVTVFDRTGQGTDYAISMEWMSDDAGHRRSLLRVTAPEKVAGSALLSVEDGGAKPDLFVSLPELKKVRKVRSRRLRGQVLGTDVSFEELDRLQRGAEDARVEVVAAEQHQERAVWRVEAWPGDKGKSAYERVVSLIDRETCVPLRIDFFEEAEEPRKRLTVDPDSLTAHGERTLPHSMTMHDLLNGTRTSIRIESVKVPATFPEGSFTREALQASRTPETD